MRFIDWDLIEYQEASDRQLRLVDEVADGAEDTIVFCRHPSVVTLGRGSKPEDLAGWRGAVSETSRGGRATYHGPGQIVIYPIVDLKRQHVGFGERDVHAFLRSLESVVCQALREIGLSGAEARTQKLDELSLTGVWVGEKKIASIGIAVRKWVTYHGCAINVEKDPLAFQGMSPCGFQSSVMTNVEEQTGGGRREELLTALKNAFQTEYAVQESIETCF